MRTMKNVALLYQHVNSVNPYFSLAMVPSEKTIDLTMSMSVKVLHTSYLPHTSGILQKLLPSIFSSVCFNDNNNSFIEEVKNTEIGHLFEHILLEYLCIEKLNKGYSDASFKGVTNWNWKEEPLGTFHIIVDIAWEERNFIEPALEKSIKLINFILSSNGLKEVIYD